MQDRLKFRVWRPDKNCYADDVSWRDDDVVYDYFLDNSGQLCAGVGDKSIDTFDVEKCQNGEIVEMCTGLKDKNGNLIYEGDIIRFCLKREGFILCYERIVIWDSDKCTFILQVLNPGVKPGTHWRLPHPDTHIIETIGNIHTAKKE